MADLIKKDRASNTRLVGADPTSGAETDWVESTTSNQLKVIDGVFNTFVDADVTPASSPGLIAYANINNTIGGNLSGRTRVLIHNYGKRIRIREAGSSARGFEMSRNETFTDNAGEGIVYEIVEANNNNEIDVYIAEWGE